MTLKRKKKTEIMETVNRVSFETSIIFDRKTISKRNAVRNNTVYFVMRLTLFIHRTKLNKLILTGIFKTIAESFYGFNIIGIVAEFFSDFCNMYINGSVDDIDIFTPYLVQKYFSRVNFPFVG